MPSPSLPPMVTPSSIPAPSSFSRVQPNFGPSLSRRSIKVPRATPPGKRRAPRGRRRSRVTSTTSCQTSLIPSYFWPDFQPSRVSSGGPSTEGALDLALMPRAYSHFPTSLPLDPLHFDFFTILRVASPVVTFHCPSPLSQKSFSFFTLFTFPMGRMLNLFWLQESIGRYYYQFCILSITRSNLLTILIFSSYKDSCFNFFF